MLSAEAPLNPARQDRRSRLFVSPGMGALGLWIEVIEVGMCAPAQENRPDFTKGIETWARKGLFTTLNPKA